MKIGNPADKSVATTPGGPASTTGTGHAHHAHAAQAAATTAIPTTADDSAKIELSSSASLLSSGGSSSEFDAAKVAQISKAIDSGTFKINPEAIADKLISNAHEALSKIQA